MAEPWIPAFARHAQRWHARLAGGGVLRMVVALVALLGVTSLAYRAFELRRGRARLLAAVEAERRAPEVEVIDRVHALVPSVAAPTWSPAGVARGFDRAALEALLGTPGLYLRAVIDEAGSPRAVHAASAVSRKDVFLSCLARPPVDGSPAALRAAAVRYRFGLHLDALLPRVVDLEVLEDGLRVASRAWLREVVTADDPFALRLLVHERLARTETMRQRAVAAAGARWFALVIDELPVGFVVASSSAPALAQTLRGTRLDEVLHAPHVTRIVLFDLVGGRPLVALRVQIDATKVAVPNPRADIDDLQACQAAVAVRAAL